MTSTCERICPEAEIEADREALSRAVGNLLENAVKYSPDSRMVQVAVARRNGSVAISVRDHGIGIPREEQQPDLRPVPPRRAGADEWGSKEPASDWQW